MELGPSLSVVILELSMICESFGSFFMEGVTE